jgi:hypothetical protein
MRRLLPVFALLLQCTTTSPSTPTADAGALGDGSSTDGGVNPTPDAGAEDAQAANDAQAPNDAQGPDASAADSAATDSAPPDAGPGKKRVFATSTSYVGDLKTAGGGTDGLDGADKLCAAAASAGSLGGTWKAWLSTSGASIVDAKDRIADVGPWYLTDGTTLAFASKIAMLADPNHAIDLDEHGQANGAGLASTGTGANGVHQNGLDCLAWTSGALGAASTVGNIHTAAGWTDDGNTAGDNCAAAHSIYCFEQ